MATLNINIPEGLIQSRIKPAIIESYANDMDNTPPEMTTNTDVLDELQAIVEKFVKSFIKNNEYKKEKKSKLQEIAIADVDLT